MDKFNEWLKEKGYGELGDGGFWLKLDRGFPGDSIWLDKVPATEKMIIGYMVEYIVSKQSRMYIEITEPEGVLNTYKLLKKIIGHMDDGGDDE